MRRIGPTQGTTTAALCLRAGKAAGQYRPADAPETGEGRAFVTLVDAMPRHICAMRLGAPRTLAQLRKGSPTVVYVGGVPCFRAMLAGVLEVHPRARFAATDKSYRDTNVRLIVATVDGHRVACVAPTTEARRRP